MATELVQGEEVFKEEKMLAKEEKTEDQNDKEKVTATEKNGKEEDSAEEEVRARLEEAKVEMEGEEQDKSKGKMAKVEEEEGKEEKVEMEVEPKTGVSFPVNLPDGKQLGATGLRRKKILALGVNIYAFGIYADNAGLKELLLKLKFDKAPEKASKEHYKAVIDGDVGMVVRLVIVFGSLTMSMVRKNFDEGLGGSLKKLTGGQKNEELGHGLMGAAKDSIKLPSGSIIEITRLPGYVLQTKVKNELVSKVESELLCRAYLHMYLGDDPFDKEAKEKFGRSLLSLL